MTIRKSIAFFHKLEEAHKEEEITPITSQNDLSKKQSNIKPSKN